MRELFGGWEVLVKECHYIHRSRVLNWEGACRICALLSHEAQSDLQGSQNEQKSSMTLDRPTFLNTCSAIDEVCQKLERPKRI